MSRYRSAATARGPVRDQTGSVAVLAVYIVLIAGLLVTALVDAGAQLQAASQADTYASEAARAAVIGAGPGATGASAVRAEAAANSYLAQAGATGTVTVPGPGTIEVSVTVTKVSPVLGITITQTRTHTAQLLVGVTNGGAP